MARLASGSFVAALACLTVDAAQAASGCGSWSGGHRIAAITEEGSKIELDDGSFWRVKQEDVDIAENWKVDALIEVCDDRKLTNTDEKETVHVKELQ